MRSATPGTHGRRTLVASILLVAFALRALIPMGFMPSSARPFSLELCWEGLPAHARAYAAAAHAGAAPAMGMPAMDMGSMDMGASPHPHSGGASHSEHCVFGTACSAGPLSHLPLLSDVSDARQLRAVEVVSLATAVRLVHLPQARAPPTPLS